MTKRQTQVVLFSPFHVRTNRYIAIQKGIILSLEYKVRPLTTATVFGSSFKPTVCILNWFESKVVNDQGRPSIRGSIRFFWYLSLLCVFNTKIVWVRHNQEPHGAIGASAWLAKLAMALLSLAAKRTIVHSTIKRSKETYIPHPLYSDIPPKNEHFNKELRFICVGRILPYKGLERLIRQWPKNHKLRVYGECKDIEYLRRIQLQISKREIDVEMDGRFVGETELEEILENADVMVLPHSSNSALVSGSYFLAKSFGLLVLCGRSELVPVTDAYTLDYCDADSLSLAIQRVLAIAKESTKLIVFSRAERIFCKKQIGQLWDRVIQETRI